VEHESDDIMLTSKQYQLLSYIREQLDHTGVSPSFEEMKDALNLKSKSGIHRLITALEERGFIRRLPHRARALELLKYPSPDTYRESSNQAASSKFLPSVVEGSFPKHLNGVGKAHDAEAVILPLYGQIAAGTPIEALSDPSSTIDVPASMLGRGDHYALVVKGDSMSEAGIFDGDTAIIENIETPVNGAIVVALVDSQEVTLKRFRQKGNSVALEPANSLYETRIFGPERIQIQGRLVGLIRHY